MKETNTLSLMVAFALGKYARKYHKTALNIDEVLDGTVHDLVTKWLQDPGNALLFRQTAENRDLPQRRTPTWSSYVLPCKQ